MLGNRGAQAHLFCGRGNLTEADFSIVTISNNLAKTVDPQKEMYSFRGHTVLAKVLRPGSRSNFTGLDAVGIGEMFLRGGNKGKICFESGAGAAASSQVSWIRARALIVDAKDVKASRGCESGALKM
jgi:hypothetical protein